LDRIEHVTTRFPDRCFAFDQFGPLSIRPCHGTCWAARTHPDRLRATYHRSRGIRYFHGCYSLAEDRRGVSCICDNLSTNTTPAIRTWCSRNKVELCLTPTNASWSNPVEAQFGPLRQFTMANSDHPALAREMHAYPRWHNAKPPSPT
jgi:hypothetical protein